MLAAARKEYGPCQGACGIQIVCAVAVCANNSPNIWLLLYFPFLLTCSYESQCRVSDVDLDEEEVLKLASFGNGANSIDTIDVLRKSLVMRNRYIIYCFFQNLIHVMNIAH